MQCFSNSERENKFSTVNALFCTELFEHKECLSNFFIFKEVCHPVIQFIVHYDIAYGFA